MGQILQSVRRVWCGEAEYDERTDIKEEFDEGSDEWFKVIVDETDEELEERLTKDRRVLIIDQINAVRRKLDGLIDQLDIFSLHGLKVIEENLDGIDIAMFSIALKSNPVEDIFTEKCQSRPVKK